MPRTSLRFGSFVFAVLLAAASILHAQPTTNITVRESFPLLTHIFFDSASATLPDRYITFSRPEERTGFTDSTVEGGMLEKYYNVLNVIGYRMRKYPTTTITVIGRSSQRIGGDVLIGFESKEEEDMIGERGERVYRYLIDIWAIDSTRIRLLPPRSEVRPLSASGLSMLLAERERVEIRSDDWDIVKPTFATYSLSSSDAEEYHVPPSATHADIFTFILFKFDSPDMGALNEKVVKDYLSPALRRDMAIEIVGHTDIIGLEDRNLRLSAQRAGSITKAIRTLITRAKLQGCTIRSQGVGIENPLFDNALPEGRYFNRCVRVVMNI